MTKDMSEEKECTCKSGIRGHNCFDYHPKEEREDMSEEKKKVEEACFLISHYQRRQSLFGEDNAKHIARLQRKIKRLSRRKA